MNNKPNNKPKNQNDKPLEASKTAALNLVENLNANVNGLVQSINLDEYDDPQFSFKLNGKTYIAQMNTFEQLQNFNAANTKAMAEMTGENDLLTRQMKAIFPDITDEVIASMHISKIAVVIRAALDFVTQNFNTSLDQLENFRKGKDQTADDLNPNESPVVH